MLTRVRYRGERAAKFLVTDQSTLLREDPQEAYALQERQASDINLSAYTGDHVLRVRAQNDFGISDDSIVIHAPAPTLDVVVRWPSAAIPEDSHVGNSVRRVDADVTVTNGLRIIVTGGSGSQTIDLDPNAASDTRSVRLPPSSDLVVGNNTITIRAENDFGWTETSLTIRRRAHVFETAGDAFLAVEASQEGIPAGDSVFVDATFQFESSVSTHDETWVVTQTLPAEADDAFLDFEEYDFQFYKMVNGDRENVSLNAIERAGAIIIGPDFQNLTLLFKPDPAWVIDEFPTRELLPGLFDRVLTDHVVRGGQRMTIVAVDVETQQEVGPDGV
jgi:hypothetical protein